MSLFRIKERVKIDSVFDIRTFSTCFIRSLLSTPFSRIWPGINKCVATLSASDKGIIETKNKIKRNTNMYLYVLAFFILVKNLLKINLFKKINKTKFINNKKKIKIDKYFVKLNKNVKFIKKA